MQERPQTASTAVLQDNAKIGLPCARSQKEHHIWMTNYFHDRTFILEFFELFLFNDLLLDFFDRNDGVLPPASVYDTVATFRELVIKLELIVRNFVILNESTSLITEELLRCLESLSQLSFQILWVSTCFLQFNEYFTLLIRKHP